MQTQRESSAASICPALTWFLTSERFYLDLIGKAHFFCAETVCLLRCSLFEVAPPFAYPWLGFEWLDVCVFDRGANSFFFFYYPPPVSKTICWWALLFISWDTGRGKLPKIRENIFPATSIHSHRIYHTNKMLIHVCLFPFLWHFVCSGFLAAPCRFRRIPFITASSGNVCHCLLTSGLYIYIFCTEATALEAQYVTFQRDLSA